MNKVKYRDAIFLKDGISILYLYKMKKYFFTTYYHKSVDIIRFNTSTISYLYKSILFLLFFIFTSCITTPLNIGGRNFPDLHLSSPETITDDAELQGLKETVREQIGYFENQVKNSKDAEKVVYAQGVLENLKLFHEGLIQAASPQDFYRYVDDNFDFYKSSGNKGKVLFTGYYCPLLNGSLEPSEKYYYPLYTKPSDLIAVNLIQFGVQTERKTITGRLSGNALVPYYTRQEIDKGSGFTGTPLVYVDSALEAFILHVQGSGVVQLPYNSTLFPVQYAGANGHPYVSIGRLLIDDGKINKEAMSLQTMRAYFQTHPEDFEHYAHQNPSYVFFQPGDKRGALGSMGLPVREGRTIAADSEVFPKGSIAYIVTERPVAGGSQVSNVKFSRFVLDRDTGGAIKGPGRVDVFWGNGTDAEFTAGQMKSYGEIYYIQKKQR
ncbi:MAG TPA: MltA domain-containing protein [Thermodesulfovibrionia bacterium]|nr:MltA domain-containing protein [Thermodesulfovibrionia bacterium]